MAAQSSLVARELPLFIPVRYSRRVPALPFFWDAFEACPRFGDGPFGASFFFPLVPPLRGQTVSKFLIAVGLADFEGPSFFWLDFSKIVRGRL